MAVSPRYCAPQEDQSGCAADRRPPKSGDQGDDGRCPSDEGNRPRDSWVDNGVALRPPLVCTGRGGRWFTHGVGTAYTPCILVGLNDAQTRLLIVAVQDIVISVWIQMFARDASQTIAVGSQAVGLCRSLRSPISQNLPPTWMNPKCPEARERWSENLWKIAQNEQDDKGYFRLRAVGVNALPCLDRYTSTSHMKMMENHALVGNTVHVGATVW